MGTVYASASDLWQLALPPDSLFEDQAIEPGPISAISHSGPGLGSLDLDPNANPRDAWLATVACVRGGELNTDGVVNTGLLPQFQIVLATPTMPPVTIFTSRVLTPDPKTGLVPFQRGGFSLAPANGTIGAPVTIGMGNASLIFTPLFAGCSVVILVGTALGYKFYPGSSPPVAQGRLLTLTVTNATTAAQAAAWLQANAADAMDFMTVAAGGDGSGIVQAAAKTALPFASFTTGDSFSLTTSASPDVVAALQTASDTASGYLSGVYKLPLLDWGNDLKIRVCQLARWDLLVRKGMDTSKGFETYDPSGKLGTYDWLSKVQQGQIRPHITQSPPGATPFPILVQPIDPLSLAAGTIPI